MAYSNYDMVKPRWEEIDDDMVQFRDTIPNRRDTLYLKSVTIGEKQKEQYYYYDRNAAWWPIEYKEEDMLADYNPDTGLICNPNHELLVRPLPPSFPVDFGFLGFDNPSISNLARRDEMAIKDFMIGHLAKEEPVSLSAPEVLYRKKRLTIYSYGGIFSTFYYISCNIYMDLITSTGELLDMSRMKVMINMDGKTYGPLNNMINPFKSHLKFRDISYTSHNPNDEPLEDWEDRANDVEVMVYYEKEDGSRVESSWVRASNVAGINDVVAESTPEPSFRNDDKVYDLTGSPVNPTNLSPGIYIRNGRKFVVQNR